MTTMLPRGATSRSTRGAIEKVTPRNNKEAPSAMHILVAKLTQSVVTSVSKKQDSSGPREPVPYARLQKANVRFPPDGVAQRLRSSGDAPLLPPHARSGHCEPRIARRCDVLAVLSLLARAGRLDGAPAHLAGRVRSKTGGMRGGRTQITMHCAGPMAPPPFAAGARAIPRRGARLRPARPR